jgi:hypothetical protein
MAPNGHGSVGPFLFSSDSTPCAPNMEADVVARPLNVVARPFNVVARPFNVMAGPRPGHDE